MRTANVESPRPSQRFPELAPHPRTQAVGYHPNSRAIRVCRIQAPPRMFDATRQFYLIVPEVAGGIGKHTVFDSDVEPREVVALHYEFQGWDGDHLVHSVTKFIVTTELAARIENAQLVGYVLASVRISRQVGSGLYADREKRGFPDWQWLRIIGQPFRDDFGNHDRVHLIVSDRALNVLRQCPLNHCDIYDPQRIPSFEERQKDILGRIQQLRLRRTDTL